MVATYWHAESNYVVALSVDREQDLEKICEAARDIGIKFSSFREPDIGDQLTAVVLEPGPMSRKLCRNFRLALT